MPELDKKRPVAAALLEFRYFASLALMTHLAIDFDELLERLRAETHPEMSEAVDDSTIFFEPSRRNRPAPKSDHM